LINSDTQDCERIRVGGQAIIEGVMMRSPERLAAAVRLPDGNITRRIWRSPAWFTRHPFLRLPIIRGAVSLAEALVLGIRTLNWSADVAIEHERENRGEKKRIRDAVGLGATLTFAVILALALFMWAPYQIATMLRTGENQALFHLIAGSARIGFFLIYLWLISLSKDIRRVFQYHGAEHQSIFTYEKGEPLAVDNARRQSRFHPRCGTSFILIVALLTMLIFVIFDFVVVSWRGPYQNALIRVLVHLPFLPLVAGISYEFLRLSDRLADRGFFKWIVQPGLSLQKITTRVPDDAQREVALSALKAALEGKASNEEIKPADVVQRAAG
jgi:uncharacterized protein YqhQ